MGRDFWGLLFCLRKKMRIGLDLRWLHEVLSYRPDEESLGGIGAYSLNLSRHLLELDKVNEYVFFGSRAYPENLLRRYFPDNPRVKIVFLPKRIKLGFATGSLGIIYQRLFERLFVADIVRRQGLDIMHFQEQGAVIIRGKYKTVVTIHDLILSVYSQECFKNPIAGFFWKRQLRQISLADQIIAISENTKRDVVKYCGVSDRKIGLTYYGLSPNFRPNADEKARDELLNNCGVNKPYFLYVGGLQFSKNVPAIVEAFSQLVKEGRDILLVLVGVKKFWLQKEKELEKQLFRLDIKNKVIIIDWANSQKLAALYSGALSLVHPVLYEGFGLVPLEAMACGCLVITSNTSSLPEVVGEAALMADPCQPEDIAKAMRLFMDDDDLRQRFKNLGIQRSFLFSWQKTAAQTLAIYQQITKNEINVLRE